MRTPADPAEEMDFLLKYEGPAVERGRMNARELGPALFATATLFERTSQILYGEKSRFTVDVKADFRRGSFIIELGIVAETGGQATTISRQDLEFVMELLGFVGSTGFGLFKFIRWLKGRKIESVERSDGGVKITVTGGENITLTVNQTNVFLDPEVRASVDGIVEPVRRPGINAVRMGANRRLVEAVTQEEADYFRAPKSDDGQYISEDEITAVLEIVSPAFREGNKWRFMHSGSIFFASVLDPKFLKQVDEHELTFGKGDALKVRARVTTTRNEEGFQQQWEILEVLDHITGGRGDQLRLL